MNEEYDVEILIFIYEMKMLNILGFYFILNECVVCYWGEGIFYFFIWEGGFICYWCLEKDFYYLKISLMMVKLLRLFYYIDLKWLGFIFVKFEIKK